MSGEKWRPEDGCLKCDGNMEPIEGSNEDWRCQTCGLEVWNWKDAPTKVEYQGIMYEVLGPLHTPQREHVTLSCVGSLLGSGNKSSGKRRKQKDKTHASDYLEV